MAEKNLDPKKKAFCCRYAVLGDIEEAALRAGYPREKALEEGLAILSGVQGKAKATELAALSSDIGAVKSGLRRLAFGSCRDAVVLAFAEELPPSSVIEGLDLFNVSEIKRDRNGGVDIKLFDRLAALEKLAELEMNADSRSNADALIRALTAVDKEG